MVHNVVGQHNNTVVFLNNSGRLCKVVWVKIVHFCGHVPRGVRLVPLDVAYGARRNDAVAPAVARGPPLDFYSERGDDTLVGGHGASGAPPTPSL